MTGPGLRPVSEGAPDGPAGTPGLTSRGRTLMAAAVTMTIAAYLFGVQELYSTALAAALAVIAARTWVWLRRWDLVVARHVHPTRVAAGQDARVELTVRNVGSSVTPPVQARDPFDGGRRWARFSIAPLRPGEVRRTSYRLPSARRGVYHLGPLELQITDPVGLAQRTRRTAPDTSLTVHPPYELVPPVAASSHRDESRRLRHPVIGKGGQEFYTLRQYVPGDDLRQVHWPSTARVDDLVIRQPENVRRGRLTVAVDLRSSIHDPESVEQVLSAAASLAMSSLAEGLEVRVVTTAGFDSGHGSSRAHGPAVLDGLAAAEPHRPVAGASPFRMVGRLDPVVLITTDRASGHDVESAIRLGGTNGTTVVVFETGTPNAQPGRRAAGRLVWVPAGRSFAEAWTRWVASRPC